MRLKIVNIGAQFVHHTLEFQNYSLPLQYTEYKQHRPDYYYY
jgi:hypothetical protein